MALPPLRERRDDIPLLVDHFVREFAKENGKSTVGVTPDALQALSAYHWPGNVRELRNVIERAVILCPRPLIGLEELPPTVTHPSQPVAGTASGLGELSIPIGTTVEQAERDLIMRTLESTGHNKTRAAEILGISLKTLHNKLKKYRKQA
jgi:DNA-binding NtrC family response regulator